MTRDELIEQVFTGSTARYIASECFHDLKAAGVTHLLTQDSAIPLDGGEAVEGVVVLRPMRRGERGSGWFGSRAWTENHEPDEEGQLLVPLSPVSDTGEAPA